MTNIENEIVSVRITKEAPEVLKVRPEVLNGKTYKIKNPKFEHALYVTINDHEEGKPFEMFLNSKNQEHVQWIRALSLVISAVFRKGGEINFLIDELCAVSDPQGGYFKNQKFMPSLVAEIGDVLRKHLQIETKTKHARCSKCGMNTVIIQSGCETCTNCGYSKCG